MELEAIGTIQSEDDTVRIVTYPEGTTVVVDPITGARHLIGDTTIVYSALKDD